MFQLTDDARAIQEMARAFATERLARMRWNGRKEAFPDRCDA